MREPFTGRFCQSNIEIWIDINNFGFQLKVCDADCNSTRKWSVFNSQ
jgi:hypothetical protein